MSKKLLKKLSTILNRDEATPSAVDGEVEARLNTVLEEHLDIIAAMHQSNHASHHGSTP